MKRKFRIPQLAPIQILLKITFFSLRIIILYFHQIKFIIGTCHFQKLALITPGIGSCRQPIPTSCPTDSNFNWSMKSSMEINTNKSLPALTQVQGSSSVESPTSTTSGSSIARSCSPEPSFNSMNLNLPCEEKVKTSDCDFAWTFEPQQVGKKMFNCQYYGKFIINESYSSFCHFNIL